MNEPLRLMCVLAHPDDESLGTGATLAKYAAEGVQTYVICATRGERGWMGAEQDDPGLEAMGRLREAELRAAVQALGVTELTILDYIDGDLDQADPQQAIRTIASHIRRVRPQVVITFDPFGSYGHPDHIAISQFTAAAVVAAADAAYPLNGGSPPFRISKLYYMVDSQPLVAAYNSIFGEISMGVDGVERRFLGWADWTITTQIDTAAYWSVMYQAIACHRSQVPDISLFDDFKNRYDASVWGRQNFYRVYSQVNGGRAVETDLFSGLR